MVVIGKKECNFLEIRKIASEMSFLVSNLNNIKIDKVFYIKSKKDDLNDIYFQLYASDVGKLYLRFYDEFLYITDKKNPTETANNTAPSGISLGSGIVT